MPLALASAVHLLDPAACRKWLIEEHYPAGPRCPACGGEPSAAQAAAFALGRRVHCRPCGRWYTYRTGTPLQATGLSDAEVILFLLLQAAGARTAAMAEACHTSRESIRRWRRRL